MKKIAKFSIGLFILSFSFFNSAKAQSSTTASSATNDNLFEVSKNLDIYYSLFKEVNQFYVDPIQPGKLIKKSIDAMLDNLDPYTNYITEDDIEDYRFMTTGKYGGIGCSLRDVGDYVAIDEIYENSPTAKAGLKSGDEITEIDGKSTKNLDEDAIRKLIKGSVGTSLKFKIYNPISKTTDGKTVTREEINVSNIPYSGLVGGNKEIAYVRLSQFTENAASNIKKALDSLKKINPNITGVILDLRYNPGGLLDESVDICNLFLNRDQLVVSTKGKVVEWNKDYKTHNMPWDEKIKLVVLVNKNSASASEIVSGTMQDMDRGIIIGQRSFGKGLVQTTRNLSYNAKLKVTTAKYYTPSGRCIQALDYTHRNEDGSVGEILDSLKSKFKTKNGRIVLDGGGIDPDIKTTPKDASRIVATLYNKSLFFDYANKYAAEHATIAPAIQFKLTDAEMNDFFIWLNTKDYTYKTKTEEELERMKAVALKENYFLGIKKEYDEMAAALSHDKNQDLIKNKDDLRRLLQDEILLRYYFQKGRAVNDLTEDTDVKEAISVLNDNTRYQNILSANK